MNYDTRYTNSYYPTTVAAQMTGYSARQIRRLAQRGKVRTKRQGRHLAVHLGSLYQHRSQANQSRRQATCLDGWLISRPDRLRREPYRLIIAQAASALGHPVSYYQIRQSFARLGWLPKPRKRQAA